MTLRFKKRRPLTRSERQFRDTRLFIIATEDTYAPKSYFQLFSNRRIQLKILPTKDGRSSPQDVSDRVNDIRNQFDLYEDDEFWLLLDTDHWIAPNHIATLQRVCQEATQKGYRLAVSNPCFELWLLLHILPAENISQCGCCADVVAQLKVSLGGYNKKKARERSCRSIVECRSPGRATG